MRKAAVNHRTISESGAAAIRKHEGFRAHLYNDTAGHCTIGYGHLVHLGRCNGTEPAEFRAGISRTRAEELFRSKLVGFEAAVNRLVTVTLSQNEFDALVSFVYNVGIGSFTNSTLLKRLNAGHKDQVPAELARWNRSGGRVTPGLVTRRHEEAEQFQRAEATSHVHHAPAGAHPISAEHRAVHTSAHSDSNQSAHSFAERMRMRHEGFLFGHAQPANHGPQGVLLASVRFAREIAGHTMAIRAAGVGLLEELTAAITGRAVAFTGAHPLLSRVLRKSRALFSLAGLTAGVAARFFAQYAAPLGVSSGVLTLLSAGADQLIQGDPTTLAARDHEEAHTREFVQAHLHLKLSAVTLRMRLVSDLAQATSGALRIAAAVFPLAAVPLGLASIAFTGISLLANPMKVFVPIVTIREGAAHLGHEIGVRAAQAWNWAKGTGRRAGNWALGVGHKADQVAAGVGHWIADRPRAFGEWMLANHGWIGETLDTSSKVLGALSAVSGVLGLAAIPFPPAAAVLGTASLTFGAAAAAAHAWYSTMLSIGVLDGTATTQQAYTEAGWASLDTFGVIASAGLGSAKAVAQGKPEVSLFTDEVRTTGYLNKLTGLLNRLPHTKLARIVESVKLYKRLQIWDAVFTSIGALQNFASGGLKDLLNFGRNVSHAGAALGHKIGSKLSGLKDWLWERRGPALATMGKMAFGPLGPMVFTKEVGHADGSHTVQDGGLTGPFFPRSLTDHRTNRPWYSFSDSERRGLIGSHRATIFVNGINTSLDAHHSAARRIAEDTQRPVTGVFNATGHGGLIGPMGVLRDVVQTTSDKFFDIGGNPAIKTLADLIVDYGKPTHEHDPGLRIEAHSQGSVIVSEAIRQARSRKLRRGDDWQKDSKSVDVVTWGNAAWTFPQGPHYDHRVHDSDIVPTVLGTSSPVAGFVQRNRFAHGVTEHLYGPLADAPGDTHVLPNKGSFAAPHALNDPGHLDYLGDRQRYQHMAGARQNFRPGDSVRATARAWIPPWIPQGIRKGAHAVHGIPGMMAGIPSSVGHGARRIGQNLVAPNYNALDRGVRSLPSLPFLPANTIWGGMDKTLRWGGRQALGFADWLGGPAAIDKARKPNRLQRSGTGEHPKTDPDLLRADLLRKGGGGFAPDGGLRESLRGHLGFDPAGARLHTGPSAVAAARQLNAEAFTIGRDVFFGADRFDPSTSKGRGLIAHELTHVGQQTGAGSDHTRFYTQRGGDEMEQEAQETAERVMAHAGSASGLMVDHYARRYETEGEASLQHADQQRLDRISLGAIEQAGRLLALHGMEMPAALERVDVDIVLDLDSMNDLEAEKVWAEAIVDALPAFRGGVFSEGSALQRRPDNASDSKRSAAIGAGIGMPNIPTFSAKIDYTYNMVENPGPLAPFGNSPTLPSDPVARANMLEQMRSSPAGNFAGGKYNEIILKEDTVFYRAGAKGGTMSNIGQWFTRTPVASDIQARSELAVKLQWTDPLTGRPTAISPIESSYKVLLPKGTRIYSGPVGYQGAGMVGGQQIEQIFVAKPWEIPGVKILGETRLPNGQAAALEAMESAGTARRMVTGMRAIGHGMVLLDAGMGAYEVYKAPEGQKAQVAAHETGRFAGGWAGGVAGAETGAGIGAGVGVWFGGVGAAPGAAIGGFIGAILGAVGGGWLGGKAGDAVYESATKKRVQRSPISGTPGDGGSEEQAARNVGQAVAAGEAHADRQMGQHFGLRSFATQPVSLAIQRSPAPQSSDTSEALIAGHTSYLMLDAEGLGRDLLKKAKQGAYSLVQETLDRVIFTKRDNVAFTMTEKASDAELEQMARNSEGSILLGRLYGEMHSGVVTEAEMTQGERILAAKGKKQGIKQFEAAVLDGRVKIFPYRSEGFTVLSSAVILASRTGKGMIHVRMPALTDVRTYPEVSALPTALRTGGINIPEDEIIGVRLYDQGKRLVYKPASYLLDINHQENVNTASMAGQVVLTGVAVLAPEAIPAIGLARVFFWADRAAVAIATIAQVINEHRGWILEKFGDSGRDFLNNVDIVNSAVAIYGGVRALVGAARIIGNLRNSYQNWRNASRAINSKLSASQQEAVLTISQKTEATLQNLDEMKKAEQAEAQASAIPKKSSKVNSSSASGEAVSTSQQKAQTVLDAENKSTKGIQKARTNLQAKYPHVDLGDVNFVSTAEVRQAYEFGHFKGGGRWERVTVQMPNAQTGKLKAPPTTQGIEAIFVTRKGDRIPVSFKAYGVTTDVETVVEEAKHNMNQIGKVVKTGQVSTTAGSQALNISGKSEIWIEVPGMSKQSVSEYFNKAIASSDVNRNLGKYLADKTVGRIYFRCKDGLVEWNRPGYLVESRFKDGRPQ